MAFQFIDETEDRDFRQGETIYDVDGNAYKVDCHRAVLQRGNCRVSYFLGRSMKLCFSRNNPRAAH